MECEIFDSGYVGGGAGITKYCSCNVEGGFRSGVGEVTIDIKMVAYFVANLSFYLLLFEVPLAFFFFNCLFDFILLFPGISSLPPPVSSDPGSAESCFCFFNVGDFLCVLC